MQVLDAMQRPSTFLMVVSMAAMSRFFFQHIMLWVEKGASLHFLSVHSHVTRWMQQLAAAQVDVGGTLPEVFKVCVPEQPYSTTAATAIAAGLADNMASYLYEESAFLFKVLQTLCVSLRPRTCAPSNLCTLHLRNITHRTCAPHTFTPCIFAPSLITPSLIAPSHLCTSHFTLHLASSHLAPSQVPLLFASLGDPQPKQRQHQAAVVLKLLDLTEADRPEHWDAFGFLTTHLSDVQHLATTGILTSALHQQLQHVFAALPISNAFCETCLKSLDSVGAPNMAEDLMQVCLCKDRQPAVKTSLPSFSSFSCATCPS